MFMFKYKMYHSKKLFNPFNPINFQTISDPSVQLENIESHDIAKSIETIAYYTESDPIAPLKNIATPGTRESIETLDSYTIFNPLAQFEIRDLLILDMPILNYIHLSFTNIVEYLTISFIIIIIMNTMTNKYMKVVYRNWKLAIESIHDTVYSIVINQINKFGGQIYFPFIYSLFIFILINNLIGMIPYSFSTTSHFLLTFALSFSVVIGSTILGFKIYRLKFFSLLVPAGCPLALVPVLVLIEFISYLTRNISLGLRLAANLFSGHMLLNILSGFTFKIMNKGVLYLFLGLLPLGVVIAFSCLELAIACIQAQVFVVLTCSYIKDSLDLH